MLIPMCNWSNIYIKCGKFPNIDLNLSVCAAAIELLDNQPFGNSSSNQITEEMERDHIKDQFQPLNSNIFEKGRSKEQERYFW